MMNSIQLMVVVLVGALAQTFQSQPFLKNDYVLPANQEYQPVCINEDGSISDEFVTVKTLPYYEAYRLGVTHKNGALWYLEDKESYKGIIWPYGSISRGLYLGRRDKKST